jgi:hypothetical protein
LNAARWYVLLLDDYLLDTAFILASMISDSLVLCNSISVSIVNPEQYPQLLSLKSCFVRGSVVRYIQIPPEHVDVELLQDATRKENAPISKVAAKK